MKDTALIVVVTVFVIVFIPITIILWKMMVDELNDWRKK